MNAPAQVTAVVVSYNGRERLRACLAALGESHADVVVVDNASEDGSAAMVAAAFPQVRLIANRQNRGFAAGCNQGISGTDPHSATEREAEYVLFVNPDAVVRPEAVAELVRYADAHPRAAAAGCQCVYESGRIARYGQRFPSVLNVLLWATGLHRVPVGRRFFGREGMDEWDRRSERSVDAVSGSLMLVRRSAIRDVGLMDEDYFVYVEEVDWCYRFRRAGWEVRYTPTARYGHEGGHSTRPWPVAMRVQHQKSLLLFFRKHRSWLGYGAAKGLYVWAALTRLAGWGTVLLARRAAGRSVNRTAIRVRANAAVLRFLLTGREPEELRRLRTTGAPAPAGAV